MMVPHKGAWYADGLDLSGILLIVSCLGLSSQVKGDLFDGAEWPSLLWAVIKGEGPADKEQHLVVQRRHFRF